MRRGGGRHRLTLIGRKFPPQVGCMNIHEWGGHGKPQQWRRRDPAVETVGPGRGDGGTRQWLQSVEISWEVRCLKAEGSGEMKCPGLVP